LLAWFPFSTPPAKPNCYQLARLYLALLETYQQADGSVKLPEVLVPCMGGVMEIK